jgi:exonuclease SbcC
VIKRIRMVNFRRHADTDIQLEETDQIVVVAGENGSGKTAILEAITYALTGEGRHGGRRLDSLVRRGAELEGMEVELVFGLGEDEYRVVRRRDGRAASAVVWVNDVPLVEGTKAATEELSAILGMDASGFRLAVVAQQKELDALIRLGGAARAKAMGRLLRLDAVTRAKDEAREAYRLAKEVLERLPGGDDLHDLAARVATSESQMQRAVSAEADCRAQLAELDAKLAASAGIDDLYRAKREELVKAETVLSAVQAELSRLEAERGAVRVPAVEKVSITRREIEETSRELERDIARGEAARDIVKQRLVWSSELERVQKRRGALDEVDFVEGAVNELRELASSAEVAADALVAEIEGFSIERETLREEHAECRAVVKDTEERLMMIQALGASCDACGQDVPHEHVETQQVQHTERLDGAKTRLDAITKRGRVVSDDLAACEKSRNEHIAAMREAQAAIVRAEARHGERDELERRALMYTDQLERTSDVLVDVDELYARKGKLALESARAASAEESERLRDAAMVRIAELEMKLADANVRLGDAELTRIASAVDSDLEERYRERAKLVDAHRGELELLGDLTAQSAGTRELLQAARDRLALANEQAGRRRETQQHGTTAAWAQKLLEGCEGKLRVSIRPALEACVSDLLMKLSDGRFTSVKISNDYSPSVLDDGEYRPIWELSGGEQDLVALALRLGIAEVVAERHGGGVGFLILDEVFGSQDAGRRASILTALRGLREEYGQIWCISHVGGLDDAADRVLDIELDDKGVAQLV